MADTEEISKMLYAIKWLMVTVVVDGKMVTYENIENVHCYTEPERITGVYVSMQTRNMRNGTREYLYVKKKPESVKVEAMPY